MPVTFDLFGTLVTVDRDRDPADAVAAALRAHEVPVPDDWDDAYRTSHAEHQPLREYSLVEHVSDALASRGVDASDETVSDAVAAAFDPGEVTTREGADVAVSAAAERGPVGVLSNCSVPGLVERTLERSTLSSGRFDAVVASVDCGWRKPHDRAFVAVADALGVQPSSLVHVGDDARTDGGVTGVDGRFVSVEDVSLADLPDYLEDEACR